MSKSTPISPWTDAADCISPDGRFRASISGAGEICMGGPTCGTLVISENRKGGQVMARVELCSPSFVWSSDSRALAVPQWRKDRSQRLCVVSVPAGVVRAAPGTFAVLELHAFEQGIVRGVDSPIHLPESFAITVEELID